MTQPQVEAKRKIQKKNNTLTLLRDMPNTIGKLQWARDTFHELSLVCLGDVALIEARTGLKPEEKEKLKTKAITRAQDAIREMVSVCSVLLPYQSPKLTAVDIKRTNNKVVTIIEDWKTHMEMEPGAKVESIPKLLTEEQESADREVDIDSINDEIEEGVLVDRSEKDE